MSEEQTFWELRRGDVLLGRLTAYGRGFPWLDCDFQPTGAFDDYRALFESDLRLLHPASAEAHHAQGWDAAFNKIKSLGIRLAPVDDAARALRDDLLEAEKRRPWICAILGD